MQTDPLMHMPGNPATADEAERMAAYLESTDNYRVLRRMRPRAPKATHAGPAKRAIFVDVETTGLDAVKNSIIELAILPFDYTTEGTIVAVGEPFSSLRDPGVPIPAEISALTGIDDALVAGAQIDPDEVAAFVDQAALVVSHNAGFDRPFCEREWPIFSSKAWACSLREIDWSAEGFDGKKLSQIAAGFGFFFDAHRAVDDCRAGVDILSRTVPRSGRTALASLLDSARIPRWRVWAKGAPYSLRETLKGRGYRWSAGEEGGQRAWYRDVAEEAIESELQYLRSEIYGRQDVEIPRCRITAYDRYSRQCRPAAFCTGLSK
jgi:DNA polymerase III subunit epsilon